MSELTEQDSLAVLAAQADFRSRPEVQKCFGINERSTPEQKTEAEQRYCQAALRDSRQRNRPAYER